MKNFTSANFLWTTVTFERDCVVGGREGWHNGEQEQYLVVPVFWHSSDLRNGSLSKIYPLCSSEHIHSIFLRNAQTCLWHRIFIVTHTQALQKCAFSLQNQEVLCSQNSKSGSRSNKNFEGNNSHFTLITYMSKHIKYTCWQAFLIFFFFGILMNSEYGPRF